MPLSGNPRTNDPWILTKTTLQTTTIALLSIFLFILSSGGWGGGYTGYLLDLRSRHSIIYDHWKLKTQQVRTTYMYRNNHKDHSPVFSHRKRSPARHKYHRILHQCPGHHESTRIEIEWLYPVLYRYYFMREYIQYQGYNESPCCQFWLPTTKWTILCISRWWRSR